MEIHSTTPGAYGEIIEMLGDEPVTESRSGPTRERMGVTIVSDDPRERWMDRPGWNLAFALQESFAYWRGLNPGHVERYNTNMESWMVNGRLPGSAYGERMRHTADHDQIERAIEQLRDNRSTRRAVIHVHQPAVEDYDGGDVSCTDSIQLFIRGGELDMHATLRSQDMYWGFPYDAQNNQFLQEAIAGRLGVPVGTYRHTMRSCHYYTDFEADVEEAAESYYCGSSPDCRLGPMEHDSAMDALSDGLVLARRGSLPDDEIAELARLDDFYADWLRVMTAYEMHRFHGSDAAAATYAGEVTTDFFSCWLGRVLKSFDTTDAGGATTAR